MEFIPGLRVWPPHANAPKFIKGQVAIEVAQFIAYLEEHASGDGKVRLDIKESKGGALYMQLNTWKKDESRRETVEDEPGASIPF